jgi:hypothetical protein
MSGSTAEIATPVLLDVIHAAEAAIPIYLETLKNNAEMEGSQMKLRVREKGP